MEENLMKMIEGYEDGIVCSHNSTGQSDDSTSPEQTLQQGGIKNSRKERGVRKNDKFKANKIAAG